MRSVLVKSLSNLYLLLAFTFSGPALAQTPAWENDNLAALTKYGEGKYKQGIEHVKLAIDGVPSDDFVSKLFLLRNAADICLSANDIVCATEYVYQSAKLLQSLQTNSTSDKEFKYKWQLISNVEHVLRLYLLSGNKDVDPIAETLMKMLTGVPAEDILTYIDSEISISNWYASKNKQTEAGEHIDKAWVAYLSIAQLHEYAILHYGAEFLMAFQRNGQVKRAILLWSVLLPIINNSGNASLYDIFKILMVSRDIQGSQDNLYGSIFAIKSAAKILGVLELTDWQREAQNMNIKASMLADCSMYNSELCADADAYADEFSEQLLDPLKLQKLSHEQKFFIAIVVGLYRTSRNIKLEDSIQDALGQGVETRYWSDSGTISHDTAKQFGKYLYSLAKHHEAEATLHIIEAGKIEARRILEVRSQNPFDISGINSHQRLIFSLANSRMLEQVEISYEQKELLFFTTDLANRSARTVEAQYLEMVSATKSKILQSSLQSLHRLSKDVHLLERKILFERVQDRIAKKIWDATKYIDTPTLVRLNGLRSEMSKYGDALEAGRNALLLNRSVLKDLQSTLYSGERYISYQTIGYKILSICVSNQKIWYGTGDMQGVQVNDIKLLQAALSNPSPPSPEVDSSFPVKATLRLSVMLLEPIAKCLVDAKHLFFTQDESVAGLSHHVLIDPVAKFSGNLTDLSLKDVPWLGARYSISVISGSSHLVAARRLKVQNINHFPFLGVGDPLLSGNTVDGQRRGKSVLRGAASPSTALVELDELPDTRDELISVAANFGPFSKLLFRQEATESMVRAMPLRDFDVIAFATHGLIREEIQGLTEPALVLTPVNSSVAFDDGLLTATDISRLNLSASLVILSACNSARYNIGLFSSEAGSLSTAFFLAGSKATLASLWSVNSEATAKLMKEFSKSFGKKRLDAATSLRFAIQSLLRDSGEGTNYSHPRYWASFMLHGDGAVSTNISERSAKFRFMVQNDFLTDIGNIQQAIDVENDIAIVGGKPSEKSKFYRGYIRKFDGNGKTLWEHVDDRHFFHLLRVSGNGDILSLKFPNDWNRLDEYKIIQFSRSGEITEVTSLERVPGEVPYRPLLIDGNHSFILVSTNLSRKEHPSPLNLRLVESESGRLLQSTSLSPTTNFFSYIPNYYVGKKGVVRVIFSGMTDAVHNTTKISNYGMIKPCLGDTISEVVTLSSDLKEIEDRRYYRNLNITTGSVVDNSVEYWGFMEQESCGLTTKRQGVAMVGSDGSLIPTFFDLAGYAGRPAKFFRLLDGYAVVGNITRRFENADVVGYSLDSKLPRGDSALSVDNETQTGIFAVFLSKDFRVLDADILFSGSDLFVDDFVHLENGDVQLFGAAADRLFSTKVSGRSNAD